MLRLNYFFTILCAFKSVNAWNSREHESIQSTTKTNRTVRLLVGTWRWPESFYYPVRWKRFPITQCYLDRSLILSLALMTMIIFQVKTMSSCSTRWSVNNTRYDIVRQVNGSGKSHHVQWWTKRSNEFIHAEIGFHVCKVKTLFSYNA